MSSKTYNISRLALQIEDPVSVYIQLRRPSDGACSEARRFEYLPLDSGSVDAVVSSFDNSSRFISKRFKPDFPLYTHILALDAAVLARQMFNAPGDSRQYSNASVQCALPPMEEVVLNREAGKEVGTQATPAVDTSNEQFTEPLLEQPASKVTERQIESDSGLQEVPPPLPEKGAGFAKLKGNLIKTAENSSSSKSQKNSGKTVVFDRSSLSTIVSDSEFDGRISVASSEDLNSRLSAAFSDYSDLTDVRSLAEESEVDVNDTLSLLSSTHTLNDRLSRMSDVTDISVASDQTVVRDSKSETDSIDTIEKQLEMLESMSVDPDCQTYSSFQMAMKHPFYGWTTRAQPTDPPVVVDDEIVNDLVYDDPSDDPLLKLEVPLPAVPPRVESMTVSTPPLPPRRFKKLNQPLPDPPSRDLGIKSALQALKHTFKKAMPTSKTESSLNNSGSLHSSQKSIYNSQENVQKDSQKNNPEIPIEAEPDQVKSGLVPCDVVTEEKPAESQTTPANAPIADPADNLTEAENYALYMTLAPLATASEFDDNETMSMLYAELAPNRDAPAVQGNK